MPILFQLRPGDTRPIYLQITDEVRRGIAHGQLVPDEALPSVRALASDLRVNPNTVQQAYRELERDGTVYVQRGRGTFIAATQDQTDEIGRITERLADDVVREAWRSGVPIDALIAAIQETARKKEDDS